MLGPLCFYEEYDVLLRVLLSAQVHRQKKEGVSVHLVLFGWPGTVCANNS